MSKTDNHQEHQMPNGVYVIEKRVGYWMLWAPNEDQPLYIDHSYEMTKLMMKLHSEKETG